MKSRTTSSAKLPILILSDSPDLSSGFARIGRDLALRLKSEGANVAYAGYWGQVAPHLPFPQFALGRWEGSPDLSQLPRVVERFFQGGPGVIFCIYDLFRLDLLTLPHLLPPAGPLGAIRNWLVQRASSSLQLWGYFPVDSEGIGGKYGVHLKQALEGLDEKEWSSWWGKVPYQPLGFDRILAYGPYGARILGATLGRDIAWAPHAIDMEVWTPSEGGRELLQRSYPTGLTDASGQKVLATLQVYPEDYLLGVVGTNQIRKDWGATFEAFAELVRGEEPSHPWKMWGHTDLLMNSWNLQALVVDLGLQDRVFITSGEEDSTLAKFYSACDVTFGLGLGEGFGFPLVESLACGTPVLHVNYGGGADLLPEEMLLGPYTMRLEGSYNLYRPVLHFKEVASGLKRLAEKKRQDPSFLVECRKHSTNFSWSNVWPTWRAWFKKGGVL